MRTMNDEGRAFSSIDFVGQCLVDKERTIAFQEAIKMKIKRGDNVLDIGTGSGILAAVAARTGASNVTAVEYDIFVANIARTIFHANGLENRITILEHDARTLSFAEGTRFDVILAEMLTTGMVEEHQVSAINNLHAKKAVDRNTIFIPQRQDTYIALSHTNYTLYEIRMPMILHLWKWHDWNNLELVMMSDRSLLNSIDFRKINNEQFATTVELIALVSGRINSIYMTSISILTETLSVGDTEALNAPMLIPIPERSVVINEKIRIKISYTFGGGYGILKARYI